MELPPQLSFSEITELAFITSELGFNKSSDAEDSGAFGTMGNVYLNKREGQTVKQIEHADENDFWNESIDDIENEIKILHYIATEQEKQKTEIGADHCLHFLGWWSGNQGWWKGNKTATYILTDKYDYTLKSIMNNQLHVQNIMQQLCEGLQFLHKHAIAHLDLKPQNIMFDSDGTLKIIDFGLAEKVCNKKFVFPVGTPYYLSPEMARGESITCKADIYSMGCICYEMIHRTKFIDDVGNQLDKGKLNAIAMIFMLASKQKRITHIINNIPNEWIKNCMAFEPSKRWDISRALENIDELPEKVNAKNEEIVHNASIAELGVNPYASLRF